MGFTELKAEYARLCADARIISMVADNLPMTAMELCDDLQRLEESNRRAQENLLRQISVCFPSVLSDVVQMSEDDFQSWILLLQEYPRSFLGHEDKFASLFWSLCNLTSGESERCFSKMFEVATGNIMSHWVVSSDNKSLTEPYLTAIRNKMAENQWKVFQNKLEQMKGIRKSGEI